jgi:Peptidase propeptide and YPEB domain
VVLAAFVARSCQQSQIRISKEQAIAIADRQVDFNPGSTQIRMLRQGLNRKPFWFVSLSDPIGSVVDPQGFTRLVVVQIDANTGKVEDVNNESVGASNPSKGKKGKQATTRPDAG